MHPVDLHLIHSVTDESLWLFHSPEDLSTQAPDSWARWHSAVCPTRVLARFWVPANPFMSRLRGHQSSPEVTTPSCSEVQNLRFFEV